ncbi:F0F1 ATP synthase subunit B [Betaproteobacteria bacterium GR16-43]|nr:F0F1 ATP synthase subunit B [Betaproteobacteria bacterium GR16-43]
MNLNFTLIAQALAFGLFIWFTVKFVWPPLLQAIEARQKNITEGLAEAEKGRNSLVEAKTEADKILADAKARAQEIVANAEKTASTRIEESKGSAKVEGDRIVAAANASIQQEVQSAKQQLREQVAALAVAGAEKILRREVDAKAHADMLNQLKAQL